MNRRELVTNAPQNTVRVRLLREIATSPVAAAFVAERWTREGSSLAVVKVLRDPTHATKILDLHQHSLEIGSLRHRHIVSIDQVIEIDGHFGLISPYVDGTDLLDWMGVLHENNLLMPPRVVCEMIRGIAVALDAAQNRIPWGDERPLGRCHGDLKPGNVMIDRDGELKVLDFCCGASAIAPGTAFEFRSAQTYVAPERNTQLATPEADIYALGVMGIELLGGRWLHAIAQAANDHDLHLAQAVKRCDFTMRSEADEQTLRSLLLRMVTFEPSTRPRAAVIAQTLRRLADRAPGPSLESFAYEHALPWLLNAPENPDTGLMVQVRPVTRDVVNELQQGPLPDEETNTMGPGDFGRIMEVQSANAAFLVDTGSWEHVSSSLSDQVADETEKAIEAARQARQLDLDASSALPFYAAEMDDPTDDFTEQPTEGIPSIEPVPDAELEIVFEPAPSPGRSPRVRMFLAVVAIVMVVGACIAIAAVVIGLLLGAYVALVIFG